MKYIKTYESVTKNELVNFFNDFGFFITLNLAKVSSYCKDNDSSNEMLEMMSNIRKNKLVNGMTIIELLDYKNFNSIINSPKLLSVVLLQIKKLIEYIEPRIIKYINDSDIKTKWLEKIEKFKNQYIKFIK